MAYPVSLDALNLRVRQAADCEAGSPSLRHPDAEINSFINVGIPRWYDEVRATTWGGDYWRTNVIFTTKTGKQLYDLAADIGAGDFLSLIGVDIFLSPGGQFFRANPFPEEMRDAFQAWPGLPINTWPGWYQIQGPAIFFNPPPTGAYDVRINYVPTAPVLGGLNHSSFVMIAGGSGYTSQPSITISGGGGSGATAIPIVKNGKVVDVSVTNPGSGYTTTATVTVSGGGGVGAAISASPTLSIDSINGWEEAIVLAAARMVARKDKDWETVAALGADLEVELARIRAMAAQRDKNVSEHIHDTQIDWADWRWR